MNTESLEKEQKSITNVPLEQRQLESVFKSYRNPIDIYTEDTVKDKEFYISLLNRLLNDTGVEIKDVYPLGSRNEVLKSCKENQSERPKIYIIDGDIYLQYEEKKNIDNLHVLDAYCIENILVCEDALCYVAYKFYGTQNIQDIKAKIDYDNIIKNILTPLVDLFFTYSIQQELNGKFELSHINEYFKNRSCSIDQEKIYIKINEIKTKLISEGLCTEEKYNELLSNRKNKFPYSEETLLKIVSAKDFIIPFFSKYIKYALNEQSIMPNQYIKFNLVKKCQIQRLECLKKDILSAQIS